MKNKNNTKPIIALLTNNDDDIYCFRKELIESIIENRYEILISCPYGKKLTLMEGITYRYDNPIIDRRGTNIISDFKLFLHYFNLFRINKPKVILTYTIKPNIYGSIAAHMLKIPVINNITGFGSILNKSNTMQKFIRILFKIAYYNSACVMFQNSTNMNMAIKTHIIKINGEKKLLPGSGVNIKRYPLQPYPEGGNGIEGEKIIFNYIGRIFHDKGIDDYIKAAKKIKKIYPNTEFNIIGFIEPTENYYKKILENLQKQEIIIYRGNQKDVKPFIKRSHAIIHPSVYGEGMSNVLLENASSGRPIITTDNPGCKETLEDKVTGLIYHGGNVDELINKIEIFLAMKNVDRKMMGKKGRERMEQNFNRDIVINAYLEKIRELIN